MQHLRIDETRIDAPILITLTLEGKSTLAANLSDELMYELKNAAALLLTTPANVLLKCAEHVFLGAPFPAEVVKDA